VYAPLHLLIITHLNHLNLILLNPLNPILLNPTLLNLTHHPVLILNLYQYLFPLHLVVNLAVIIMLSGMDHYKI
jgi:hypothetical protein